MKLEITAEDIAAGIRQSCSLCPAALAARRLFDDPGAQADTCYIYLRNGASYRMPTALREWVLRFDAGLDAWPGTFELEPA